MKTVRRLALLGLASVIAGCTGNQGGPGLAAGVAVEDAPAPGVELTVRNETTRTLRVFVLAGGFETPLGRVDPLSDRSVRLSNALGGTVSLVARASETAGDQGHVSEPVEVLRGHRIVWVLRGSPGSTGPGISYVRVFRCDEEC